MVWMLVIVSTWLMCGIAVSRSAQVPGGGWRVLAVCFGPLAFALGPRHFAQDSGPQPTENDTVPCAPSSPTTVDVLVADAGEAVRVWLERLPVGHVGVMSVVPCSVSGDRYMVALDAALDVYTGLHGLVDPDHASLVMVESDEPAVATAHAATSGGYDVVLTSDPEVALHARELGAAVLMADGGAAPAPDSAPTEMAGGAGGRAHLVFAGEMGGSR